MEAKTCREETNEKCEIISLADQTEGKIHVHRRHSVFALVHELGASSNGHITIIRAGQP